MAESVKKVSVSQDKSNPTGLDQFNFEEHLSRSLGKELVFGLCGPIGSDINYVSRCLNELMSDEFNYKCKEIKLSDLIRKNFALNKEELIEKNRYYEEMIDRGNQMRKVRGNDILAKLASHVIAKNRTEFDTHETHSNRACYIINSIKHTEELELLQKIYSNQFYLIGTFSTQERRRNNLENLRNIKKTDIESLIQIDSNQNENFGQKVSKVFPQADYFMRVNESQESIVKSRLKRFLDLIFATSIASPNVLETAMYQAFSAAGNSTCLSRQVGASITDSSGNLLSVGWNDVPKFGGGLYPFYDDNHNLNKDHRCLNRDGGTCFNDFEKKLLANHIVEVLNENNVLLKNGVKKAKEVIAKDTRLKGLIEFSRSVHAEMHAIIQAAQNSADQMLQGKLFCTTYPCHNCARHIIAAGIKEIYYIEPYEKSLALKLHGDAITENETEENKVKLLSYDGVSPSRYNDLFQMKDRTERKKSGKMIVRKRKDAVPKHRVSIDAIAYLESKLTGDLKDNQELSNLLQQL